MLEWWVGFTFHGSAAALNRRVVVHFCGGLTTGATNASKGVGSITPAGTDCFKAVTD